MNFFVVYPEWGFWITAYFYLGGIAANVRSMLSSTASVDFTLICR